MNSNVSELLEKRKIKTMKTVKFRILKDFEEGEYKFKAGEIKDFGTYGGGYKAYIKMGVAELVEEEKPEIEKQKLTIETTPSQNIPEEWIWFYHNNGFSIIPLGVNKNNKLKEPSISSWEKYEDTPPTKEEIQQWIKDNLFKNIGVICGHVSNDLVIIDIDNETIPEIIGINWDNVLKDGCWGGRTGKGYQIYCRHHGNPNGIQRLSKYNIEYRANRGYCVIPPSTHPNGNIYHFIGVKDFTELPNLKIIDAQAKFKELKEKIGTAWNIKEKTTTTISSEEEINNGYPKCVEIALNKITEHPMRDYTIYGIASSFYYQKIPKDMAMQKIKQFNLEKCSPPHSKEIVERAVDGAYEEDAHRFGCEFWIDQAKLCPYENITDCPFGNKKTKRELAEKYKIFTLIEDKNKNGEKYYIKTGVIPPRLADLIINEYDYHFFTMRDSKEIYYYKNGVYQNNGETIISSIAEEYMEDLSTTHRKNEVISHILDYNYQDREEIKAPINLINLNNGILDINTYQILPHSPNYFFINQLPVKYDPNMNYEKFEKFLQHISMKDGEIRKKIVNTIQEYIGYSLYRGYPLKYYMVLDGGGDNGKTVLLNIVTALIGEKNNTSIGLQELNERPFAKSQLYGKHTNVSDDLPKKALKLTGIIKQITGNSPMWADIKNHKKGISFTNYAKPWYACNELPETSDYTDAFFSRQLQITLLNKYLPVGDKKIDNITVFERNVHLTNELTKNESLSGILNYAIIGLKRLLEKKVFSDETTTEDKRFIWIRKTNPVGAYIDDEIEITNEDWCITKDDFYNEVIQYCLRSGFDKPSSTKYVTTKMRDANLGIQLRQKKIDGIDRVWCWVGLKSATNNLVNHYLGEKKDKTII